jgi:hypothetical protein
LSVSSFASNEIKLNVNADIKNPTLVTLGIPVKENQLNTIDNFTLYNEKGEEVNVFVRNFIMEI